jgi:hypothetical protein
LDRDGYLGRQHLLPESLHERADGLVVAGEVRAVPPPRTSQIPKAPGPPRPGHEGGEDPELEIGEVQRRAAERDSPRRQIDHQVAVRGVSDGGVGGLRFHRVAPAAQDVTVWSHDHDGPELQVLGDQREMVLAQQVHRRHVHP